MLFSPYLFIIFYIAKSPFKQNFALIKILQKNVQSYNEPYPAGICVGNFIPFVFKDKTQCGRKKFIKIYIFEHFTVIKETLS